MVIMQTLMLPDQDDIATLILSDPHYEILEERFFPMPKSHSIMWCIKYARDPSVDDELLRLINHPGSQEERASDVTEAVNELMCRLNTPLYDESEYGDEYELGSNVSKIKKEKQDGSKNNRPKRKGNSVSEKSTSC